MDKKREVERGIVGYRVARAYCNTELGPSNGALDELGVGNIQDGSSDV